MVHHNGTNPDIPSPYIASISFSWIFKDFSIAASRFLHRKRNKSISPQRLPHSRIYSSYVSHATVEICSRENLEVVSASGIRIKLASCGRRLLFRRLSVPSISRPALVSLFIFFSMHTRITQIDLYLIRSHGRAQPRPHSTRGTRVGVKYRSRV